MNASKQMSRIEVKAAPLIRRAVKEEEYKALEAWRQKNRARISWDLFALLEGPKLENPADYVVVPGEEDVYIESELAYFAMLERVLKHGLNEEGYPDRSKMTVEERAFAVCLEHLYWAFDDDGEEFLRKGIVAQAIALGLGGDLYEGKISLVEAVRRIDEHRGGPEWRQIWDNNSDQEALDAKLGISSIKEIPPRGRAWVDPDQV